MAAFTAANQLSGFSPAVLAQDVEQWILENEPVAIDLRDPISFHRANLNGSTNISQGVLRENLDRIPKDEAILLISDDGQKGHVALRMLAEAGFSKAVNLSGGFISLERHGRAAGYEQVQVGLFPIEKKSVSDLHGTGSPTTDDGSGEQSEPQEVSDGPLILDELMEHTDEFGAKDREIAVYCASGARSSYATRLLEQAGFTNVRNAGGLHQMMANGV